MIWMQLYDCSVRTMFTSKKIFFNIFFIFFYYLRNVESKLINVCIIIAFAHIEYAFFGLVQTINMFLSFKQNPLHLQVLGGRPSAPAYARIFYYLIKLVRLFLNFRAYQCGHCDKEGLMGSAVHFCCWRHKKRRTYRRTGITSLRGLHVPVHPALPDWDRFPAEPGNSAPRSAAASVSHPIWQHRLQRRDLLWVGTSASMAARVLTKGMMICNVFTFSVIYLL